MSRLAKRLKEFPERRRTVRQFDLAVAQVLQEVVVRHRIRPGLDSVGHVSELDAHLSRAVVWCHWPRFGRDGEKRRAFVAGIGFFFETEERSRTMALTDSLFVFVVSLLVGGFAIYVAGRVVAGVDDYSHAVVTALLGAIVWGVLGFLVGWIPLLGPLVVLLVYVGVINWRYPGGWVQAGVVALTAWVAALVVLYVLAAVGIHSFDAVGVPGT